VSPTICSEAVCITGVALLSYANAHVENYGLSDHRGWPDSARCSRSRDPNLRSILARSSADDSRTRRSYTSDALPYGAIQICFIISIIKTITTSLLYGKSAILCVIYRTKDKNHNFGCLSNCRYCADRVEDLPGPAPNNVFTVLQISSKSVHFRRNYSRTREHLFCPVEYFHYRLFAPMKMSNSSNSSQPAYTFSCILLGLI